MGLNFIPIGITNAANIKDVLSNDQRSEAILDVINKNAIGIDSNGNFYPEKPIKKAEFYKALYTYIDYKPDTKITYNTGFTDVPASSWFAPFVKKAVDMRVITISTDQKFNPDTNITRLDALIPTLSVYGIPTPYYKPVQAELFTDTKPNSTYSYIYASAKKYGISFSKKADYFYPSKVLTRGDAAELLFKAKYTEATLNGENITPNTPAPNSGSVEVPGSNQSSELAGYDKFDILADTWNKINDRFIYQERINKDELIYGAITGMLAKLNDPYSTFYDPQAATDLYAISNEEFEGIGVIIEFQKDKNQYVVQTVLNRSPASKAGLKSDDVVLEINGKQIASLKPEEVSKLIKGKAGTVVSLKISRNNVISTLDITRDKITYSTVDGKMIDNEIAYIKIDLFADTTGTEFENQLALLLKNNPKKILIDLRDNPGGLLSSTKTILGHYVKKNELMFLTESSDKTKYTVISDGQGELAKYPTMIMMNGNSASASEIMAGTLQDYGYAKIVGEKSFGKGSVQDIYSYYDGSALKLSVAHWLTPKERYIDHVGITPDIEIKVDSTTTPDQQLTKAIAELKKM